MKKKVIVAVSIILVLTVALCLLSFYRSELIIHAFKEYGFTATEINVGDARQLDSKFSEEQLEKVAEYKIYDLDIPDDYTPRDYIASTNRGILIVCPSAKAAKELLKMSDDGLYEQMKEYKTIKGNCILFTDSISMRETFNDYLIANLVLLFI